jgi:LemA protein
VVVDMNASADTDAPTNSLRRVKESEALLAKLYVVEDVPQEQISTRTVNGLLVVSILSILLFVATLLLRYNLFVTMHEDVLSKQSGFEVAMQRRDNLFENLVKLTLNHAALEHSVFAHVADKRAESLGAGAKEQGKALDRGTTDALSGILKEGGVAKLLAGEGLLGGLGRVMAIMEQYPNIQSAETYKQMITSLINMEDRIASRRDEYNVSLSTYNAEITKWPWDYLATITGFKRIEYYHYHDRDSPNITPQMFQELLPMTKAQEIGK